MQDVNRFTKKGLDSIKGRNAKQVFNEAHILDFCRLQSLRCPFKVRLTKLSVAAVVLPELLNMTLF
eukprot:1169978-Amphidinium_carterae.1